MQSESLENIEDILAFEGDQFEAVRKWLINEIEYLLHNHVERLKAVLYRIDIDEQRLKKLLVEQPDTPASEVIAEQIIKRQLEKVASRKKFGAADWSFDV